MGTPFARPSESATLLIMPSMSLSSIYSMCLTILAQQFPRDNVRCGQVATPQSAVLLTGLLAGCLTITDATSAELEFSTCTIGNDAATVAAECATLSVPVAPEAAALPHAENIDRSRTELAPTIDIHIARLPAREPGANVAPITLIAGGPGQSSTDVFPSVLHAFRHLRERHDVILVDQRGTGQSAPLECPAADDIDLNLDFDVDETRRLSEECLLHLEQDPRWYTTSVAVVDLDGVRRALGYPSWHLYGVSYGTRVAIHYARRFPEHVNSLLLDAVVPPGIAIGEDVIATGDAALQNIFARCAATEGCNTAFPDIESQAETLLDELATQARRVTYEDVSLGQQRTLEFTADHLSTTLRLLSYSAHGASILPSLLADAINDDYFAPLARLTALQIKALGESLTTGMYNAVICTEDAPLISPSSEVKTTGRYLRTDVAAQLQAACSPWPNGVVDSDFHTPFESAIPTLIMSGSADPITPPSYGEVVLKNLSNARHVVNTGLGHMQAPHGCMPQIIAEFVTNESPEKLDTDCLNRLQPPAFFIDANGPLP